MNKRLIAPGALVLMLAACGGGSSGSGSSDSPGLVGTWIQTNDNYSTDTGITFKLRRQTIIVTREGNDFRFTDCISGESLLAPVSETVIDFYEDSVPSLEIKNSSTLTTTVDFGFAKTDVVLNKVSDRTAVKLATVDFTSPSPVSPWDQVCVETILDKNTKDEVKLKAVDNDNAVAVGVNFSFADEIVVGQYDYPSAVNNISGYLNSPLLDAEVFNPVGTVIVSDSSTRTFALDLLFQNTEDSNLVSVAGNIDIHHTWFSYE